MKNTEIILTDDEKNVLTTLYFCEQATWTELLWWTKPRLKKKQLDQAVAALIERGQVICIRQKRPGVRAICFLMLSDSE